LNNWYSFNSPDYFHNCSTNIGYLNARGYQQPHSGEGYVGMLTYKKNLPNIREFVGIELIEPLEIGAKYYLTFNISTAYRPLVMNMASNKIGALFTTYSYFQQSNQVDFPIPNPNFAHLYNDGIVTDTTNWVRLSWSFVADSLYKHLVIGNFFDDSHTELIPIVESQMTQDAYYYLDDVCLTTDSLYAQNWTTLSISNLSLDVITVSPNPASDFLHINSQNKIEKIEIFDFFGHLIFSQQNFQSEEYVLDIEKINAGIYFVKIRTEFAETIKKMVKE
jgi:hypothetical protein